MIQILIYLAMAAAAAFAVHTAWSGFKDHIAAPYVQAQIAADQPKIAKAEKGQADAEGERDHARADTALCVAASMKQSTEVDKWKATADANAKAAREARDRAAREAMDAAPRIAELKTRAAAAPVLMLCQEELDKTKDTLRQALRVRRGLPAVPVTGPAALGLPAAPNATPPPTPGPAAPVLVK